MLTVQVEGINIQYGRQDFYFVNGASVPQDFYFFNVRLRVTVFSHATVKVLRLTLNVTVNHFR